MPQATRKLTWRQAAAWRAARQHLDRRAPAGTLLVVASRLCGLHAQLMSSAALTVWARVDDLDRDAVERALWQERTLVKTWAMRGTLHLLPAAELPLWQAVLSASPRYLREALWLKYFGITLTELDRLTESIGAALEGRVLTRDELVQEVARLTRSKSIAEKVAQSSWGTILKPAAFTGRLCFAPSVGQRVRFTHPSTWLPAAEVAIDRQSAPASVARRFLSAYGPATYHDLARWWGGGGISTAREWIAALSDEASAVDLNGGRAWMLAADVADARNASPSRSVRLLPAFDQYVVAASHHAEHLIAGAPRERVYRPQGWISPILLVDGIMRGTWRHEMKGSRIHVTVSPFMRLPEWVRRSTAHEAERLAAFYGCTLRFSWKR